MYLKSELPDVHFFKFRYDWHGLHSIYYTREHVLATYKYLDIICLIFQRLCITMLKRFDSDDKVPNLWARLRWRRELYWWLCLLSWSCWDSVCHSLRYRIRHAPMHMSNIASSKKQVDSALSQEKEGSSTCHNQASDFGADTDARVRGLWCGCFSVLCFFFLI